jgi:hypothetical protein
MVICRDFVDLAPEAFLRTIVPSVAAYILQDCLSSTDHGGTMAEIITTVEDVKVVAEGSNNRGPWTKTAVVGGDGREYATFDGGLASQASALKGKVAKLTFKESVRGKYTNLDLESIEEAEAGATPVPAGSNSKKDEFRSKEEIRYTAALDAALTAFGIAGVNPVTSVPELYELADEFYLRLEQVGTQGGTE